MLDIKKMNVSFKIGQREMNVCSDVSFTLPRGKVLGLIGESGSGKTVTSKALLSLLPDNAVVTASQINFDGKDISKMSKAEVRKLRGTEIAMIFQDPVGSFNPVKTIGWHFLNVAKRRNKVFGSKAQIKSAAIDALHKVEIGDPEQAFDKFPHQLSGGMLQRCLIALTLFCKPTLIIADEPTTNLDNLVERQIIDIFDKLRHEIDASFIFITHDMMIAEQISDEIAVMYAGQIVEHGDTAKVMADPRHPYTQALIRTARELESEAKHLTEIPGDVTSGLNRHGVCRFGPRCPFHEAKCDKTISMQPIPLHGEARCIKALEGWTKV